MTNDRECLELNPQPSDPSTLDFDKKQKKQQISLTINPDLLAKLDVLAAQLGQSRASLVTMAVYNLVENGFAIRKL